MERLDDNTDTMEMKDRTPGRGEQGEYDNDGFEETPFTDNQDNTEGGDTLVAGGAGSPVSGPSLDAVAKQVREAMGDGPSTSRATQIGDSS